MSEQLKTVSGEIIKWDRADRMRKSLRVAGMTPGEMAEYLDVGGNTVSTWINGRIEPTMATQRLWALRTGVPFTWLHHGDTQPCDLSRVEVFAGQSTGDVSDADRSIIMQCLQSVASA